MGGIRGGEETPELTSMHPHPLNTALIHKWNSYMFGLHKSGFLFPPTTRCVMWRMLSYDSHGGGLQTWENVLSKVNYYWQQVEQSPERVCQWEDPGRKKAALIWHQRGQERKRRHKRFSTWSWSLKLLMGTGAGAGPRRTHPKVGLMQISPGISCAERAPV